MSAYIIRRMLTAIPLLVAISIIGFIIIQLPEGDFLDRKIQQLEEQYGDSSSLAQVDELRQRYGLDQPIWARYLIWVTGFVQGDFGESFEYEREVNELIWDRLGFTILISICSLIFTYALAIPVGIYSATHQYSWSDHVLTLLSFIGMSLPGFLVALASMVLVFHLFDLPLFGLFSSYYEGAPWTFGKLGDLLKHLWIPVIVVAINGTAGLMRIMRGNLLDVLGLTVRADGSRKGPFRTRRRLPPRRTARDQPTHQHSGHEPAGDPVGLHHRLDRARPADRRPPPPPIPHERRHLSGWDTHRDVQCPPRHR